MELVIPGRRIVVALAAEDVGRILAEALEPFHPASWEKRRSPAPQANRAPSAVASMVERFRVAVWSTGAGVHGGLRRYTACQVSKSGGGIMAQDVADYLLERLRQWNVRHVFGYPGDGINGIVAAFGRADNKPQFVQARHEEMAAFEATGYAKFSGESGCAWRPPGPGAIHLLNGLYDAKLDHVPVVAIVGQTARSAMGGTISRKSTCRRCLKMWRAITCRGQRRRANCQRLGPRDAHRPHAPRTHRRDHPV